MSNELDKRRESSLQAMMDMECMPVMPELDLTMSGDTKIPLAELSALGVAFQPIASAIQTAVSGGGGSGIYFVNTMGKQMFTTSGGTEFIGSLQTAAGTVGGGQARLTELACDPTMLFMAAALMSIEKKLDTIQETQEEILDFLEEKERAKLQGNLNVLGEVLTNFKYNWDNQTYKTNKHILIQQIKKDSEESIFQVYFCRMITRHSIFCTLHQCAKVIAYTMKAVIVHSLSELAATCSINGRNCTTYSGVPICEKPSTSLWGG